MKIIGFAILILFSAGCFYGKIKVNDQDRSYIPYQKKKNELVFSNGNNQYDTITLFRSVGFSSNLDFFIDRKLGSTTDTKKPYLEVYKTNIDNDFEKLMAKAPGQPYIKCDPFIFSFNKSQHDSLISLYYVINGRWRGNVYFNQLATDTLSIDGLLYKDVIILRADTMPILNLDKLYWSIQHGLIRIDERNGQQWRLVKEE